jgi:predicted dehydrogenase
MSKRIGLIGLDSSHAEDFLRHFNLEGRYTGFRITAMADGDEARMDELDAFAPGLDRAASLNELLGMTDAVIVGHRHGDQHRAAAIAALAAGKPTFVDKPLANSVADADAIVAASEMHGTPLLSGSALRWQAETARLKARVAGIEGDYELMAYGTWYPDSEYGGAVFYAIHTVELVQELLGIGWKKLRVRSGTNPAVQFKTNGAIVSLEFRPLGPSGSSAFGVDVEGKGLEFKQPIPLGDDYMAPVAAKFAKMLESGKSCLSHEELVAPLRLMREIEELLG